MLANIFTLTLELYDTRDKDIITIIKPRLRYLNRGYIISLADEYRRYKDYIVIAFSIAFIRDIP